MCICVNNHLILACVGLFVDLIADRCFHINSTTGNTFWEVSPDSDESGFNYFINSVLELCGELFHLDSHELCIPGIHFQVSNLPFKFGTQEYNQVIEIR